MNKKVTNKTPNLRFSNYQGEWMSSSLGDLLSIGNGKDYKHLDAGEVPVFGTGGLMKHVNKYLHDGESVFIGRKGTINKPFYYNGKFWTVDTLFFTHSFKQITPKFAYLLFQNINWEKYNEATGVPSLSKSTIGKIIVNFPTINEQRDITEFFTSVDEWIETLKNKKIELQNYKKAISYCLFNNKIRLKDKDGNDFPSWQKKRLGELFHERNDKSGKKEYKLLSVKINGGVVPQGDINKTDSSNSDKSKYKVVKVGDIAYNTMRMWQGASGVSQYEGIVSPAYTVVYTKKGDANFYGYLFKHPRTIFNFYRYSQGLTSDTWNLKFQHFSEVEVTVPSNVEEQKKIAAFLSSLDELIEHKEKQIALAEQWKKGLLQQMFI